jgi:hypothetical protein
MRATRTAGYLLTLSTMGLTMGALLPSPPAIGSSALALVQQPDRIASADSAALTVAAALAWLVLGWLAVAVVLVIASSAPGWLGHAAGAVSRAVIPSAARHIMCAALGVSLLASAAPATAAMPAGPHAAPAVASAPSDPRQLNLDWPVDRPPRHHPTLPASPRPDHPNAGRPVPPALSSSVPPRLANPSTAVVVQPGDTLWGIAAQRLGPGASDRQIGQQWPRWWAVNRQAIGNDPDLINPGQRLTPPASSKEQNS